MRGIAIVVVLLLGLVNETAGRHLNVTNIIALSSLRPLERQQHEDSCSVPTTIVVARDKSGNYDTIQAALDSISKIICNRVIIYIKAGVYREKVTVKNSFITFKGDGASRTVIEWSAMAKDSGPDGKTLGTFHTATVAIDGDHFVAKDLSIKNLAPPPPNGAEGRQAVALRVSGDMAAFYRVNIYGAQDTLYDHRGRHYFSTCRMEGSIDIIVGDGRSLYSKCHLHSIANSTGSLTAQKRTYPSEATGFVFVQCRVTGSGQVYLGRAWGPYSRVVYAYTSFPSIILPQGWEDWMDARRRKTVFYGEYRCFGPGAKRNGRVKWSKELNLPQVQPFLHISFIDGQNWLDEY